MKKGRPVESRTGAVALGFRWSLASLSSRRLSPAYHDSVSHPRSSNRTCGSPASGFPTGFTLRHTSNDNFQLMPATTTCAEFRLRLEVKLSLESPNFFGVCRPMANHLILFPSKSVPEARALSSTGITRPQRSYGPLRLPP